MKVNGRIVSEWDKCELSKIELILEVREKIKEQSPNDSFPWIENMSLDLLNSLYWQNHCRCIAPGNSYVCARCRAGILLGEIGNEEFVDESGYEKPEIEENRE